MEEFEVGGVWVEGEEAEGEGLRLIPPIEETKDESPTLSCLGCTHVGMDRVSKEETEREREGG